MKVPTPPPQNQGKICIFCKHWYFYSGSPGYSEYTPCSDVEINCDKDHWEMDYDDTRKTYREKLLSGLTCSDFEEEA